MRSTRAPRRGALVLTIGSALVALSPARLLADVRHVRAAATGANDGSSWRDAFTDLQLALSASRSGDEIWVAAGTYTPAPPNGLRRSSFDLKAGVAVYGGFAGSEVSLAQRDVVANLTILSGDLNGDDSRAYFDWTNHGENVWHVVRGNDVGASAVLDGFTVRGGYADTPLPSDHQDGRGGGIVAVGASPSCRNLRVIDNRALQGGGVSRAMLSNSVVAWNEAQYGGGVFADVIALVACRIFANRSTIEANAVKLAFGNGSTLVNCLVYGNSGFGPAILGEYVGATAVNCTVAFNQSTASACAGVADFGEANGIALRNSILWGNRGVSGSLIDQQIGGSGGSSNVIEGLLPIPDALANVGADPRFRDPSGSDRLIGTSDDDYRLSITSRCIDSGSNVYVPASVATDVDGLPRFVDTLFVADASTSSAPVVDRGAHEMNPAAAPGVRPHRKR